MNKTRRKELDRAVVLMEEAKEILEAVLEEEQDYFDNMPENLQQGEKGIQAEDVVSALEEAVSSIETAIESAAGASA